MIRTYRIDRLYHRFLKPKGIPLDQLPALATRLQTAGFIDLGHVAGLGRYIETTKLISRDHRDELFKLIQLLNHPTKG